MSALLKRDDDIYAVKQEMFEKGRIYLRALVDRYPGTINFNIGAGRIYRGLDTHLPAIAGLEDEKKELCQRIAAHAYRFAASEFAQAINFKIIISQNKAELAPSIAVEEGEFFMAADAQGGLHSVFLPPYHALANAAGITIARGLSIACRVINPGYHRLQEDRGLEPFDAASNLPNKDALNRFRDRPFDREEEWPPPSFLKGLSAQDESSHDPVEIEPKLPPEIVVPVFPFVANHPSHPESLNSEDADFVENREPAFAKIEPASGRHATAALPHTQHHPTGHPAPAQHPVDEAVLSQKQTRPSAKPASRTVANAVSHPASLSHKESPPAARHLPATENEPAATRHPAELRPDAEPHLPQPLDIAEITPVHIRPVESAHDETAHIETLPPQPARRIESQLEAPHIEPSPFEPSLSAEAHEAPHLEPKYESQPPAEAPHVEPAPVHTVEIHETPFVEPRHIEQVIEADREPVETLHNTDTPASEPVPVVEVQSVEHVHAVETPHIFPHNESAASLHEPQSDFDRREIKFAEKEELEPHIVQAGFTPAHDLARQASHAPAYGHLLEVPTHHHSYDPLQPVQKKLPDIDPEAQQAVVSTPSPNPEKIAVIPADRLAPRRLSRAAFLKHLHAPIAALLPGEDGEEG